MKIIHCADLHLDSKLDTHLSSEKAKERKNELFLSFKNLIEEAKTNEVSIILISGDLFDKTLVSKSTKQSVLNLIKSNEQITFFYLLGNHDDKNIFLDDEIPSNLKLFSNKWDSYEFDNITISGIILSEETKPYLYQTLKLDKNKFNIVMLHGDLSKYESTNDDSININKLKNKNINYLAMGHIHQYKADKLDDSGIYVYPGCLEGRGFDEIGEKGYVLIDIDSNNQFTYTFKKSCKRELINIDFDISNYSNWGDISINLTKFLADYSKDNMIKVILKGTFSIDLDKNIPLLEQEINSMFYFGKVVDNSRLLINTNDYKNDVSLKGEFIRQVLNSNLSKEEQLDVIMMGLKALSGEEL